MEVENFEARALAVSKVDADTHFPVVDTDFVIWSYPGVVVDGVLGDVSGISADDGGWVEYGRGTTDLLGRLVRQ